MIEEAFTGHHTDLNTICDGKNEQVQDKTYNKTCVTSKDSQLVPLSSLTCKVSRLSLFG